MAVYSPFRVLFCVFVLFIFNPDYPLVAMIPQEDIYLYGIRAD